MADFSIFTPVGATKKIAVTSSTGNVALSDMGAGADRVVRVYNDLNEVIFIKFGFASTLTAAVTDLPIGPKATEVFEINPATTYVAAISASGSGNVYFTEGKGA